MTLIPNIFNFSKFNSEKLSSHTISSGKIKEYFNTIFIFSSSKKNKIIPENCFTEYDLIANRIRLQSDSIKYTNEEFSRRVSEKNTGKFIY